MILNKKEIEQIIKTPGEVRGLAMKAQFDFVAGREGREGIRQIEEEFEKAGYPLKESEVRPLRFYPVGYDIFLNLVIANLFNFTDEDFFQLGAQAAQKSLIVKIFTRYFYSLKSAIAQAVKLWRQYYTFGEMEAVEINENERMAILRLKNYPYRSRIGCNIIRGYIAQIGKMVLNKPTDCRETKCEFNKDPYHEFLLTW